MKLISWPNLAAFFTAAFVLVALAGCGNKAKEENHYHYGKPPGNTSTR